MGLSHRGIPVSKKPFLCSPYGKRKLLFSDALRCRQSQLLPGLSPKTTVAVAAVVVAVAEVVVVMVAIILFVLLLFLRHVIAFNGQELIRSPG